ncbi:MAG: hypothetical protein IPH04_01280 [Saprospirales bacterium]|nr:hypothetical protein [Saprospirales bacterium]
MHHRRLEWKPEDPPSATYYYQEVWGLHCDTLRHRLYCSSPLHYYEEGKWEAISFPGLEIIPAKSITFDPSENTLWTSFSYGFYKVDLKNNAGKHFSDKFPLGTRTFTVTPDDAGNIWVTTVDGLRLWKSGKYEPPLYPHYP